MKILLALASFAIVHGAHLDLNTEWESFKIKFERNFVSQPEHDLRKAIFHDNLNYINQHNAEHALGLHTYTVGVNKFTDLTVQEFAKRYNNYKSPSSATAAEYEFEADGSLPESIDWRTEGYVTPVKNQAECQTCWSFAAVAAMEGAHAKKTGNLVSLSEQNLVDCMPDMTCLSGGSHINALGFVVENGGIDTEASYPYHGTTVDGCQSRELGANFTSAQLVAVGSEEALTEAVARVGPIAVAIDASLRSFMSYKSGVYSDDRCSSEDLDHSVTVVGYGSQDGQDYYLVKNSWTEDWGEQGYVKMRRNYNNHCGIANEGAYPIA